MVTPDHRWWVTSALSPGDYRGFSIEWEKSITVSFDSLPTGVCTMSYEPPHNNKVCLTFQVKTPKKKSKWSIKFEMKAWYCPPSDDETFVFTVNNETTSIPIELLKSQNIDKLLKEPYITICTSINILEEEGLTNTAEVKEKMFKIVDDYDVLFEVESSRLLLSANTWILSKYSKVFKKMFKRKKNKKEESPITIDLGDIEYSDMLPFLELMYGHRPKMEYEPCNSILKMCEKFDAPSIRDLAVDIITDMHTDELIPYLLLSQKYDLPILQNKVIESIESIGQLKVVISDPEFSLFPEYTQNLILKNVIGNLT